MVNCSPSPSDEGGLGRRRSPHPEFLSHLHTGRASGRARNIGTNSNMLPKDQAPVDPDRVVSPPKRRSLAVSFGMTNPGDANMDNNSSVGGRGTAHHQHHEEASGTISSTSSCASSKSAVARFLPDQASPPLGETSRFRGSTVRDTWSERTGNPDGEFTFRCSSTMHKTRASTESAGFDLVGAVVCCTSESPVSSISSHRYSGKRWASRVVSCSSHRCRRVRFGHAAAAGPSRQMGKSEPN